MLGKYWKLWFCKYFREHLFSIIEKKQSFFVNSFITNESSSADTCFPSIHKQTDWKWRSTLHKIFGANTRYSRTSLSIVFCSLLILLFFFNSLHCSLHLVKFSLYYCINPLAFFSLSLNLFDISQSHLMLFAFFFKYLSVILTWIIAWNHSAMYASFPLLILIDWKKYDIDFFLIFCSFWSIRWRYCYL